MTQPMTSPTSSNAPTRKGAEYQAQLTSVAFDAVVHVQGEVAVNRR